MNVLKLFLLLQKDRKLKSFTLFIISKRIEGLTPFELHSHKTQTNSGPYLVPTLRLCVGLAQGAPIFCILVLSLVLHFKFASAYSGCFFQLINFSPVTRYVNKPPPN